MKKTFRKVIASAVMVLFALISLATSTYAWFTMNDKAKVGDISLQATNENAYLIVGTKTINGNLLEEPTLESLRENNADSVSLAAFYTGDTIKVKPIAHETLANITDCDTAANWYYHIAKERTSADKKDDDEKHYISNLNGYMLHYDVYVAIAAESVDMYNLQVESVEFTSTDTTKEDLKNAVKVIVASDTAAFECDSSTTTFNTVLADKITITDMIHLRIYVYVDGNNTKVFSNNYANLAQVGVSINLTASDKQ